MQAKRIKVAVIGYQGRMGQVTIDALDKHPKLMLGAKIGRQELQAEEECVASLKECKAFIDFSHADAQLTIYTFLQKHSIYLPMITGVTGLSAKVQSVINLYAQQAPVLQAANFSIGIALLKRLSRLSAQSLDQGFDTEIFELHHRHKQDSPSGTAYALAEAIVEGKQTIGQQAQINTDAVNYLRKDSEIHISAGRGGGVFGDHSVFFLSEHERIELKHSALNRSVFADGALRAAQWCLKQSPGLYQMDDLWA